VEGEDYWPGEGNENIDPGFGADGYHLGDASPLWNGGIAATVINGITYECPETDIDGEPMPWGFTDPEIGADETPSGYVVIEEPAVGGQRSAACPECEARRIECYPNPTSGIVYFRFSIPHPPLADSGHVVDGEWISLKVYNAQGQELAGWRGTAVGCERVAGRRLLLPVNDLRPSTFDLLREDHEVLEM
jgi:hypothetical protein